MSTSSSQRISVLAMAMSTTMVASPAWAQLAAAPGLPVANTSEAQTAAPDSAGIQDIVVTAQRQEQTLQKAAVPIDAVSGDSLIKAGITNALDITKAVPALTVTNGGGSNTSLYLRGIGNRTTSSWTDPAVAVSYDSVFLGRSAGAFGTAFFDLQRVEVLLGPQGILYGRNATGGAINIIPSKPELDHLGAGFSAAAGNYDTVQSQAYVNVPIGADVAVRISGARQVHDGYNRDGTDDQRTGALRGQILYKPNSDLSIRVGGDYTHVGGFGTGSSYLGNYSPNASGGYDYAASGFDSREGLFTPAANAYRTTLLGAPGFGFLTALQQRPYQDYTYWGVNAEMNYKTPIGTFTLLPAYRHSAGSTISSVAAFNNQYSIETDKQYSVEGRLTGKAALFDYILGSYYFHERIDNQGVYNQEFVLPTQIYTQKTDSYAAFGQLTAHLTDRLRLVGGARYTHDYKDMNGLISNLITFCGGLPPANLTPPASFAAGCAAPGALPRFPNFLTTPAAIAYLAANGTIAAGSTATNTTQAFALLNGVGTILKTYNPVVDNGTYSKVTWKAGAEYDLGPRSLLYATVQTGYRAGGFQLAEGRPRYNPEFLTAYTVGSKNRFFDNRVQLNLEAFYWKYRDQQITYFTVDTSGTLISSTENAGRATSKGIDADLVVQPARNTTLSGKVQYLKTRYDDLHLFTASPRDNINCGFTLTGASAGGQPVKDFNCSGRPLLFSPKWTVNLGAEQRLPIGDYELVGDINTAWRDDQEGGFEYLDFEHISAYWTTDVNVTLRHKPSNVAISAFVLNVENKRRLAGPQLAPTGQAVSTFTAPRTYGLRVSADF